MKSFAGEFTLVETGISGWARCNERGAPVWVEALADGESVGCVQASLAQPDGCGFWLPLPHFVLGGGCEIRARIANTDVWLDQTVNAESSVPESGLAGEMFLDRGLTFSGWAVDRANPDAKLRLRALENGVEIATCVAARPAANPEADGHAFIMHLPASLADCREHELALVDSQDRQMPGSPMFICLSPLNISDWLQARKKFEPQDRELFIRLLRHMEMRAPGVLPHSDFSVWKKMFPPVAPGKRRKIAVALRMDGKPAQGNARLGKMEDVIHVAEDSAEWLLFLRSGEKLHSRSIALLVEAMEKTGASMAYADSETPAGEPLFKPAWDLDAFLAKDYLGPILARKELVAKTPFAPDYAGLRLNLVLAARKSGGVAHVASPLSVEMPLENDPVRTNAINAWLAENHPGSEALAQTNMPGVSALRIRYSLAARPRISIIIPTKDHGEILEKCLDSLARTDWDNLETVIIDNGTSEKCALEVLDRAAKRPDTRVLSWPGIFNYAAINNFAVAKASGELICFLNNDTEIIDPAWLGEMAALLLARPDNGCVGAKLLWPNGLVQHGGVVIGTHQLAAHVGNDWLENDPGYMERNQFTQQYSAVTAACMLTHKKLFQELGGFDERRFAVNFNDTDYCLRVREVGRRVLWTPFARLLHHESASRGADASKARKAGAEREMHFFRSRWGAMRDPFYNPSLPLSTVTSPFYGLAIPPRSGVIRYAKGRNEK